MGRMSDDRLQHLRDVRAYHLREAERAGRELEAKGHQEGSLYHDTQQKRWGRLRALSRALLFLLLAFAPVMRDLLRVWLRWLGIDL